MSKIQDFKDAPVGATATSPKGLIALKTGKIMFEWSVFDPRGVACDAHNSDEMEHFTLVPSAPTTACGALDLAWELAYPVKEGQVIPEGTRYLQWVEGNIREYTEHHDLTISKGTSVLVRTLDPLPDPEPEWLDAPAVLASMDDCSWQKVWLPRSEGRWVCTCCGVERHWSKMSDVTPLYPKGTEND